ncbi:hypothetical protein GCM10025868_39850 [Angustibacter aerolatus]|uniref:Uncharacterized protein n=1 Tax=Angustibacter aerolatus TaxID=1162965 RepID=A0ABQ6JPT8_9ACTN|nr:hypothetical protein GCM10025868_39850 [Angustibacter aerolatus]
MAPPDVALDGTTFDATSRPASRKRTVPPTAPGVVVAVSVVPAPDRTVAAEAVSATAVPLDTETTSADVPGVPAPAPVRFRWCSSSSLEPRSPAPAPTERSAAALTASCRTRSVDVASSNPPTGNAPSVVGTAAPTPGERRSNDIGWSRSPTASSTPLVAVELSTQ